MDDLTELLSRIAKYSSAYEIIREKPPLFRLTPYEHMLFLNHLFTSSMFSPEYYGDLPKYMGVNFEIVGNPILFNGNHIRSDSGIELEEINA